MAPHCTCTPENSPCPRCRRRIERAEERADAARDGRATPDPDDEAWAERVEHRYERWLDKIGGSL